MTDQRKVWTVTSGEYSDYSIVAHFSSEELANRYVEIHGGPNYSFRVEDGEPLHDAVSDPVEVLTLTAWLERPVSKTPDEMTYRAVPGIDHAPRPCEAVVKRLRDGRRFIRVEGTDHQGP